MLGLSLTGPAFAQPDVPAYSYAATGCMKLRECTDDVIQLTDYAQLRAYYGDIWYDDYEQEITALIDRLAAANVEVYLASTVYFPALHRGLYYTDVNRMFLNSVHMFKPETLLEVLRHEGWHAAQDCMAGTIDNTFIAVIHNPDDVPKEHKIMADIRYGLMQPRAVPWEQEAIWASDTEYMTADALNACASGAMWTEYEPTPKTRQWLEDKGFIK